MTSLFNISGVAASIVSLVSAASLAMTPIDPAPVFVPLEPDHIVEVNKMVEPAMSTTTVAALVRPIAEYYGADPDELYETIKCESQFRPEAVGLAGELGVAQIYLVAHPQITPEQARDPIFAIQWSAREFAAGREYQWTCWRLLYGQ